MSTPNTKRSGGPRTAAGVAITAGNALKSGAYSKQVVLPGEDAQQFEELKVQLVRDFDPVGVAEAAMVHDLAVLTWKKLRVDRVEHAVMTQLVLLPMVEDRIQKSFGTDFLPSAVSRLVPFVPVTPSTRLSCQKPPTLRGSWRGTAHGWPGTAAPALTGAAENGTGSWTW